jgi:hypothetical protein
MARRGGAAAAESSSGGALTDEVESLGPSESTFSDPLRAERPEPEETSPPPPPSPPPSPTPDEPGRGGATVAAPEFDPRVEIERLRGELSVSQQRQALFERELQFRALAAQQAAAAAQPQPQIDPALQEVIDILQVSEDDLMEVFQGGAKGAQIVTRALQATALLAIQAAEKRLVQYYQRDQGQRQQAQVVETRAGQMHQAFWSNYPELADHEIVVQHFAAQVAQEQAQAPRFDWQSAQQEVAARTVQYLAQKYNTNITTATPTGPGAYAAPRPTLQSRLRPAFGEMGGGRSRGDSPSAQNNLTAEILDLGR